MIRSDLFYFPSIYSKAISSLTYSLDERKKFALTGISAIHCSEILPRVNELWVIFCRRMDNENWFFPFIFLSGKTTSWNWETAFNYRRIQLTRIQHWKTWSKNWRMILRWLRRLQIWWRNKMNYNENKNK